MDLKKSKRFLKLKRIVGIKDNLSVESVDFGDKVKIVLCGAEYRQFAYIVKTDPTETRVKIMQALHALITNYSFENNIYIEDIQ